MARWNTDNDALRDLDRLSEFTSGREIRSHPAKKISSQPKYKSFGRGELIEACRHVKDVDQYYDDKIWNSFTTCDNRYEHGMGRGQLLETMARTFEPRRGSELQKQLREACGSGFSNELIESQFGHKYESVESESDMSESTETSDPNISDQSNISTTRSSSAASNSSPSITASSCEKITDVDVMEKSLGNLLQFEDADESSTVTLNMASTSNTQSSAEADTSSTPLSSKCSSIEKPRKPSSRTCKLRNMNALLCSLAANNYNSVTLSSQMNTHVAPTQESLVTNNDSQSSVESSTEGLPVKCSPKKNSPKKASKKMSPYAPEFIPSVKADCMYFSVDNNTVVHPTSSIIFNTETCASPYVFEPSNTDSGFQYRIEEFPPL